MQIIKNNAKYLSTQNLLKFYFASGNPFTAQVAQNGRKNAVRFENQNRIWTFEELEKHSNAFAYGLVEQGYKPGDKLLVWAEKASNAEIVGAQIGAGKAGVTVVTSYAQSQEDLAKDLQDCRGLLYSPNTLAGEQKYSEIVNDAIPELEQLQNFGSILKSKAFPKLQYVVHTGFYTLPGSYKYRDVLVYASQNFNTLKLPQVNESATLLVTNGKSYTLGDLVKQANDLRSSLKIQKDQTVVVAGDARSPLSFALGILNSTANGNYSLYTGNTDFKSLANIVKLYNEVALVLDSDVAQNQSAWDSSISSIVKSVALLDRGNGSDVSLNSLFSGATTQSYKLAL